MKPVYSEMVINAPAEIVWKIITNPDAYPQWNVFIPRITLKTADVVVGAEFDLDCQMTDTSLLRNEREVVLELSPEDYRFRMGTSRTRGRPGIVSNRCQQCLPIDAHSTRYINYEEFSGLLSPIVYLLYGKKLKAAFEKHNAALKRYAESLARG
jgi:hypothetical protein